MNANFLSFKSGVGDCLFLVLSQEDRTYSIMVDCNLFTTEIEKYVVDDLACHLDLLIVTHVDSDHVKGIIEMLKKHPNLQIGKMIFNCFQCSVDATTDFKVDKGILNQIKSFVSLDSIGVTQVSVREIATLASLVIENKTWFDAWEKIPITDETEDLKLGTDGEWGTIRWLSPYRDYLDRLYSIEFVKCYNRYFHKLPPESGFKNQEEVYEVLIEMADKVKINKTNTHIGTTKFSISQFEHLKMEGIDEYSISIPNQASLAFEWVLGDKSILFLGDSLASVVENSLRKHYSCKHVYDVIKISHHGSAFNTSVNLCLIVDSSHFFVAGGNKNDKPSASALAKILCRSTSDGIDSITLHFPNAENAVIKWLQSEDAKDLREKYKFNLEETNYVEV